jgi:hypothetical protein
MERAVCNLNVKDIAASDRRVLEHVFGVPLQDEQRLVVQIVGSEKAESEGAAKAEVTGLPEWCRLYEGMTDKEIEIFEETVLTRANMTREFE